MGTPNISKIIIIAALALTVLFGKLIAGGSMFVAVGIALALAGAVITFMNPEHGLILLVFSMLLSPEIELARIPGRSVTVRVDDFLLVAVFIAYLAYHALNPASRRFIRTPIGRPLTAMIAVYIVSTAIGILEDRLNPLTSTFFALKYIQYFLLFWLAVNVVSTRETLRRVIIAGALTAVIVCIYAYSLFPKVERVYPPFDSEALAGAGVTGESATLGGYLLIVMSLALAFFANYDSARVRLFALALFFFAIPPFVRTLSRASYYSFAAAVPALVFFTPKRKMTLLLGIMAFLVLAPVAAPRLTESAIKRLGETFTGPQSELGIDLELSAAARVESWRRAFVKWLPARPLFGHGATGVGLVDTQYPRILGEFGVVGFVVFLWLVYSIYRTTRRALSSAGDALSASVSSGFLAAFVGLLVQGVGVNTFIIVRIMTPFWFLLGVMAAAGHLEERSPHPAAEARQI